MDSDFVPRYTLDDEERFKDCEKLFVACQRCGTSREWKGICHSVFGENGLQKYQSSLLCDRTGCKGLVYALTYPPEAGTRAEVWALPECRYHSHFIIAFPKLCFPLCFQQVSTAPPDMVPDDIEREVAASTLATRLRQIVRQCQLQHQQGWLKCEDPMCGHRTRSQPLFRQVSPKCLLSWLIIPIPSLFHPHLTAFIPRGSSCSLIDVMTGSGLPSSWLQGAAAPRVSLLCFA